MSFTEKLTVNLKAVSGLPAQTKKINCTLDTKGITLRNSAAQQFGIPVDQVKLIFNARTIKDSETLAEIKAANNANIFVCKLQQSLATNQQNKIPSPTRARPPK